MLEIEEKIKVLKSRETKGLIEKLHQAEDALETALRDATCPITAEAEHA